VLLIASHFVHVTIWHFYNCLSHLKKTDDANRKAIYIFQGRNARNRFVWSCAPDTTRQAYNAPNLSAGERKLAE